MGSPIDLLSRLEDVQPGAEIMDVVTSERINSIQHAIKSLFRGENIQSGVNVRKTSTPSSVMLSLDPSNTPTPIPPHPFQAVATEVLLAEGIYLGARVKVHRGHVFNHETTAPMGSITDEDEEFELIDNDMVWLEVYFTDAGTITGMSMRGGTPSANGWTTGPELYDSYGGGNTWFHPICKLVEVSGDDEPYDFTNEVGLKRKLRQYTHTHLVGRQHKNHDDVTLWGLSPYPNGGKASEGTGTALTVWEEDEDGEVADEVSTLAFIGKRTVAASGATAAIVEVTIDTVEVQQDGSQRAEAVKTINFVGDGVTVTSEGAAIPGAETGDGAVTVTITGIPEDYTEEIGVFTVWNEVAGTITARKMKFLAEDLGVFSG